MVSETRVVNPNDANQKNDTRIDFHKLIHYPMLQSTVAENLKKKMYWKHCSAMGYE